MSDHFHLLAILKNGTRHSVKRLPINRDLQEALSADWHDQHHRFCDGVREVPYDVRFTPQDGDVFSLSDFELPEWLHTATAHVMTLEQPADEDLERIAGVVSTINADREDIILFQNFTRSRVISPRRALLWMQKAYSPAERPGLTLDKKLSAVYYAAQRKLLFLNYRTVNSFLPLQNYYWEASEEQIREMLTHDLFAPEDIDAIAVRPTQSLARQFAKLHRSGLLGSYSAHQVLDRAKTYGVDVSMAGGRVVFPADLQKAKKLLQFLCEERFRGAMTGKLYETNSMRPTE